MDYTEMIQVVDEIEYKNWVFDLTMDGPRPVLQVQFLDGIAPQKGRKWFLSPHMTKGELIQTCFKAVITAEEHEIREKFFYRERAVFGPHIDIDVLWEAAGQLVMRKEV